MPHAAGAQRKINAGMQGRPNNTMEYMSPGHDKSPEKITKL